jgi:hypothetical protein
MPPMECAMTITIADWLIILATLLSPLIAVQVQKWIERATERRDAQLQVFYDLMATRATRVAPKHVEALNKIDLEFRSKGRPKEREVLNRWRIYADHLNIQVDEENEAVITQWHIQRDELFTDLLEALAAALGYPFNRVELRRGIYYPRAHSQAEIRKEIFEREIVRLLTGNSSLNMRVTDIPPNEEGLKLQLAAYQAVVDAIKDGALNVKSRD